MPAMRKRLGASILLTILSLISIIILLPTSRVSTHLRKIPGLNTTINNYAGLLNWATSDQPQVGSGIRMVVFGDSMVDSKIEKGEGGKGRSWTEVLCQEMNCSSYLNFAKSQPSSSYPSSGPTGSMTSNKIVEAAYAMSQFIAVEPSNMTLPDFAAQIQSFIALPPPTGSEETVFVVSFGTWDIYNLAGLDYSLSPSAIDSVLDEYFNRLDIICSHFKYNLTQTPTSEDASSNSADTLQSTSIFRVIIPKLFDPTMLPGWLSQRPLPLSPSSIAEQQKNAVYLTSRWNNILENKLGPWMSINPSPPPTASESESESQKSENKTETGIKVEKDVYYYDLDKYLVNVMMERSMELEGITDASGLGSGESVFESVYLPCVGDKEDSEEEGLEEVNGMVVCKEPDEYLFYDSWSIGRVAKKAIGNEVAGMMRNGKSLRQTWKESGKPGFA